MKNLLKISLTVLTALLFTYNGYSGCDNRPDANNGDCTYATNEKGENTYFCENSLWNDDCVKATGGGGELEPEAPKLVE